MTRKQHLLEISNSRCPIMTNTEIFLQLVNLIKKTQLKKHIEQKS